MNCGKVLFLLTALGAMVGCGATESSQTDTGNEATLATATEATQLGFSNFDYIKCANEGETCTPGYGNKYIAYGSDGKFTYRRMDAESFKCTAAVIGSNPNTTPGAKNACYYANYGYSGDECYSGASCPKTLSGSSSAPVEYAFGANGSFVFKTVADGKFYPCNLDTFGRDPAVGIPKSCYTALPGYKYLSNESSAYIATGLNNTPVAYGAEGKFSFKRLSGSIKCDNATFGDPNPGVRKKCYMLYYGKNQVATEGSGYWIQVKAPATGCGIQYTSGNNGAFLMKASDASNSLCSGTCGSALFNWLDPDYGYVKYCYGLAF